ncbi:MAG: hypothetical protein DRG87_10715 [Deltaproteobacteria bacterium]|nr:MAG: hypothetical protein DRG87_10715 [Deltaproteobacteria bacterium]
MIPYSNLWKVSRKRPMKIPAIILAFCLTVPLWLGGCSEEETAHPPGEHRNTVVPIKKAPQGKAEFNSPRGEEELKDEGGLREELHAPNNPEIKRKPSDIDTEKKQAEPVEEATGYYIVKPGDGLSEIAARDEVYGDPLKWPILYFYNMDKIGELQLVDEFLDRDLPEGERLRIITPREARENLRRRAECTYTVNVISARSQKGLISSAIRLMREGYPVYITSATVRGREWMRLRVGFFETKIEASLERMKINDILSIHNSWIAKVEQYELEEFGGLIPHFDKAE